MQSVIQRLRNLRTKKTKPRKGSVVASVIQPELPEPRPLTPAEAVVATVWIVNCEVADELPGVMLGGAKVAVAPVGSPLAARVTGLVNEPFCAATAIE